MRDGDVPVHILTTSAVAATAEENDGSSESILGDALRYVQIAQVAVRSTVQGQALVLCSDIAHDRAGRPYLTLLLRDQLGCSISARWWRYPYPVERRPAAGTVCWFRATVDEFAGERQLSILEGRPVANSDLGIYAVATRTSLTTLQAQLEEEIAALDPALRALVWAVLSEDVYARYCEWPAAQHHHAAVRHGLLAHSLRVTTIARHLARLCVPEAISYDVHLVTAASLLHDVGKTQTLPRIAGGALPERAQQVDHVTLGVLLIRLAATTSTPPLEPLRLEALTHALLAHHGRPEWGAPVEPATLEAWLVHLADLVDARLWRWSGEEEAGTAPAAS